MKAKPPGQLITALSLIALLGCDGKSRPAMKARELPSATTLPAPALTASRTPVILIYADSYSLNLQTPRDQVEAAVWGDGRMVWRARDGSLLQADIDTSKIDDLLQRLHRQGVFGD